MRPCLRQGDRRQGVGTSATPALAQSLCVLDMAATYSGTGVSPVTSHGQDAHATVKMQPRMDADRRR